MIFNRDIRPILSDNCFACHGPDATARQADLRLDVRDAALAAGAIVPGDPQASPLLQRILSHDPEQLMPPPRANKKITAEQTAMLERWIQAGAEYQTLWSFLPVPASVPVPDSGSQSTWVRNPIDAFVLATLRERDLQPAAEATREQWLRRASFDLTGLPPTLEDLDTFRQDQSPAAYEHAVDRLLERPVFGERMANDWLDVARYADTYGYQSDREMHVWPWRDWCIRAFNNNLPYDQFIIWQTAGDMLPDAPRDAVVATAFNRLHRQTNEGGSIPEEFRAAYVADRVVTNGTAFLGLTLECARCHDHKFDPITQNDFYSLAAFYADIDEFGLYSHFTETAPSPAMLLYEGSQQQEHEKLLAEIAAKEQEAARIAANFAATVRLGQPTEPPPSVAPVASYSFDEIPASDDYRGLPGKEGQAIEFGGDAAYACQNAGAFDRTTPFTFSLWLRPADHAARRVVLHRSVAAEDAGFRGYSLVLDQGHVAFSLVHFWPGNAIRVETRETLPLQEWTHVTVTYDGSSKAAGLKIYLRGTPAEVDVRRDQLTRDITYRGEWGDSGGAELSLGARFRDLGFTGGAVDELKVFDRALTPREVPALAGLQDATDVPSQLAHYLAREHEEYQAVQQALRELRQQENQLVSGVRQLMTMQAAQQPRPTHVLKRGAYDAPGDVVTADTPAQLLAFPAELPRTRLGLARWMVDNRNPLVSRVAVNRFWQIFFGRGLVATSADFGSQGQPPSHPELLDWLSRHFMDNGWNVKQLCKLITLSATYRQSSVPRDAGLLVADPENQWLARGPRHRWSAEQIRDNALAISGLLVPQVGGPSVYPYQPAGLWEESGTGKSYSQSTGDGLYRRSLYTFWRRTAPPPSMLTFDATSREVCTARREPTGTPTQALVLLNDPQYIEAARVLAQKLLVKHGLAGRESFTEAFRLATSRGPNERELQVLERLYSEQRTAFAADATRATALLDIGESKRDESLDAASHAALTVLVQTLMNLDECVVKR